MNIFRNFAFALLASAPLLACGQQGTPPAPRSPPAPPPAGASSMIGRSVEKAIDEARKELRTKNISISDGFNINVNGRKFHSQDANLPKAEITPQGDLLIEGKAVPVAPAQRQQLLAYRGQIIGIAEAGMTIGERSADLAGEALGGAVGAIFGGKDGEKAFEQRMEAQGKQIEAEALKLCMQLPGLLASQQALAASLPEFKPYARMTREDIDDCGKEGSMSDAERAHVREEIRNGIRESIRGSVRGTVQAASDAEAAQATDTTAKPATSSH